MAMAALRRSLICQLDQIQANCDVGAISLIASAACNALSGLGGLIRLLRARGEYIGNSHPLACSLEFRTVHLLGLSVFALCLISVASRRSDSCDSLPAACRKLLELERPPKSPVRGLCTAPKRLMSLIVALLRSPHCNLCAVCVYTRAFAGAA